MSLHEIVGTGRDEFLACAELALPCPAAQTLEGRKTVLIDRVDITPGAVAVQGRLRATWTYQVAEVVQDDGQTAGPLWAVTGEAGFTRLIPVTGAAPGMNCRVTEAHVSADASQMVSATCIAERSLVVIAVVVTTRREGPGRPPSVVAAPHKGRIIGPNPPSRAGKGG